MMLRSLKALALVLCVSFTQSVVLADQKSARYPLGPDPQITPGSLCNSPDAYRYPEHIPYCNRNVSRELKHDLMKQYDDVFGYSTTVMPRQQFKIDHFIPLCAGGSNNPDNLWPQHVSVYSITDEMEPLICGLMAQGKLKQADAVEVIRQGKLDLSRVKGLVQQLNAL